MPSNSGFSCTNKKYIGTKLGTGSGFSTEISSKLDISYISVNSLDNSVLKRDFAVSIVVALTLTLGFHPISNTLSAFSLVGSF
jgi:hypothetical protein